MYCTCRCNGSQLAMKPDIGSESRLLPTPPAFDAPIRGFPVRILPCRLVRKKVEWLGYPTVKKFWRYVYWFWHNPRTWQTDTHTDGQTDTAWRQRPRLHSIARQKLADAVKSHLNWRLWQALLHCWQDKWRVRSSVDVTVTSTFCLWTDGSSLTQSAAQTACQQRNGSFLPRVANSNIQSKLQQFRNAAGNLLYGQGFWIDARAVGISPSFYWIDNSGLAG